MGLKIAITLSSNESPKGARDANELIKKLEMILYD